MELCHHARGLRSCSPLHVLNGLQQKSGNSQIRVLNASIDYSSLDLYLDNGTTNTPEITAATYGTLTSYVGVGAASYTVEFTRNGVSSR